VSDIALFKSVIAPCSQHSTLLVSAWIQARVCDSMHGNMGDGWRNSPTIIEAGASLLSVSTTADI